MIGSKIMENPNNVVSPMTLQYSLRLALKQKGKNIRHKSFREKSLKDFNQTKLEKPLSFLNMFNKLTNKIKNQAVQQKKKKSQYDDSEFYLIGQPITLDKLKINTASQNYCDSIFLKQKINIPNSTIISKLNNKPRQTSSSYFHSKNTDKKRLSMTNYSQKIRKGSNISRQKTSLDVRQQIQKSFNKIRKIKTQIPQRNPKDQFRPIGFAKTKYYTQRYLTQRHQTQNAQYTNQGRHKQEQQEQPLKQKYIKMYKIKENAHDEIKGRVKKNMRKLYTSYKNRCEDKQKQKGFSSQKNIKPQMFIVNSNGICSNSDRKNDTVKLGPWIQQKA